MASAPSLSAVAQPEATAIGRADRPWRSFVWVLLASAAILCIRKTDAFLNPQFWADDGVVYFMDARNNGAHSLLEPHWHVPQFLQRLIAYVGSGLPVRYAPAFYNWSALALTLAAIAYIARSRIDAPYRPLLALALVAVPHQGEVFMTLMNVHWILALVLVVLALSRDPTTKLQAALELIAFACLCLTGPFIVLFLPLFLVRAFLRKTLYSFGLAGIAVACAGFQLRLVQPDRTSGAFDLGDPLWRDFWGRSLSGTLLLGRSVASFSPESIGLLLLSVLLYGFLAGVALYRRDRTVLAFLFAALAVLLSVAYSHRHAPGTVTSALAYRYSYVPFVCTVWALIVTLGRRGWPASVAAVVLIMIALAAISILRAPPLKDFHWAEASRCIGGSSPCRVLINPEGWHIDYFPPAR